MLLVSAKKIDFVSLFGKFINDKMTSRYGGYYYDDESFYDDCYGGIFDAIDDESDWWGEYRNYKNEKNKSSKKSKKSKNDSSYDDAKTIWLYPDVDKPYCKEKFTKLSQLDEYLDENDIIATESDVLYLMNNDTIHASYVEKMDGKRYLVVAKSYANLSCICQSENDCYYC